MSETQEHDQLAKAGAKASTESEREQKLRIYEEQRTKYLNRSDRAIEVAFELHQCEELIKIFEDMLKGSRPWEMMQDDGKTIKYRSLNEIQNQIDFFLRKKMALQREFKALENPDAIRRGRSFEATPFPLRKRSSYGGKRWMRVQNRGR